MKNLLRNFKKWHYIVLGIFILSINSCTKNTKSIPEISKSLVGKTLTFDKLFDDLVATKIDLSSDTAIYINYEWNKPNNTIKIAGFEKKEIDFFYLDFSSLDKNNTTTARTAAKNKYKVSCENGKESWTKTCDGKFGCGTMVYDCLEKGGCATICKNEMVYLPQKKEFILLVNKDH